jgi:hypothetical protein
MTYDAFKVMVAGDIIKYLPSQYQNYEIKISQFQKVNGEKTGISLRNPEVKNNLQVTGVLYLEERYKELKFGKDYDEVLQHLADDLVASLEPNFENLIGVKIENLMDTLTKDKIMPRLIPQKGNEEMLKQSPHFLMDDLAVLYYFDLENASIRITNQIANEKKWLPEEIHQYAKENIEQHILFGPMHQFLAELMQQTEIDLDESQLFKPMFILTNDKKQYGAAAVVSDKIMEKVEEIIGEDFYIIPSSQHEVIILPNEIMPVKEVEEMIKEVNRTEVSVDDFLSDCVYRYNKKRKQIELRAGRVKTINARTNEKHKKYKR